jgi:hypothetical protein
MSDESGSSVGATETGSASVDAGVAELTNDFYGSDEPSTGADEGAGGESGEQGEQAQAEQPAPAKPPAQPRRAERVAAPAPAEQKIKYRGREYTLAELAAKPEVVEAMAQSAEQLPHLQQKYLDALERQRNAPSAHQPAQAAQGQPGAISPQRILQEFLPEAQAMEAAGFFDPGFVETQPLLAAQLTGYRKVLENVAAGVAQYQSDRAQGQQFQQVSQIAQSLDRGLDSLPAIGPQFEAIKNPEVRAAFRDYLINVVNPESSKITGEKGQEFLARQFFAFQYEAINNANQQQAAAVQNSRNIARSRAAGEAGSARPAAVAEDPWLKELDSFGVGVQGGRLVR